MPQPLFEITVHPVDLSRHGKTPSGLPVYRVVWADSRKSHVIRAGKRFTLPRYLPDNENPEASATGRWIVEQWMPPEQFVGMTREQYEDFLATFPSAAAEEYPTEGDYELKWPLKGNVDEAALHALLEQDKFRRTTLTAADRKVEAEVIEQADEKAKIEKFDALYDEAREETMNAR
jgi:hypothetical protein